MVKANLSKLPLRFLKNLAMTITSDSLPGLGPSESGYPNKFIRLHPADSEFPPIQGFFYLQSSKAGFCPVRLPQ